MDALELLHNRVSVPVLGAPGPDDAQLESLLRAGLRAPDHRVLRPWRFLVIRDQGLDDLGELFVQAARSNTPDLDEAAEQKLRCKPKRAPAILVVVACLQDCDKVPEHEQLISAGCCASNIMLAAHALGLGAMWRTGGMAEHPLVLKGLGLQQHERLIGFIYLGTPAGAIKRVPDLSPGDFAAEWPQAD